MARKPKHTRAQDRKSTKLFVALRESGKRIRLLPHAKKEIKTVQRFLRKYGGKSTRLGRISRRVNACSEAHPCHSGACPRCTGEVQSWFARAGAKFLRANPDLGPWHTLSWVPPGQDGCLDLQAHKRRFERQLRAAGVTMAISGIDLSWNVDKRGNLIPHRTGWVVQLWAVIRTVEAEKASAGLRALGKPDDQVPHPVRIAPFDGSREGLAYALKPNFVQRQTVLAERNDTGKLCRNTRQDDLTVATKLELYPALDRAGVFNRVVMIGCQLRWIRKGPRIRLRKRAEP